MSVKCSTVMEAMERLAPVRLAESWDNIGLLLGSPDQDISSILVVLDMTPRLLAKAAEKGVDLIVSHHPLIFKPLSSIRTDLSPGNIIAGLLKQDIALYAAHTNLDAVSGGVSDILAERLGLTKIRPLLAAKGERMLKLVVFVPESHIEAVRAAVTKAGAGHVGNYSHCTFQAAGTGTFLPLEGTDPFIGRKGVLEFVPELRLETILPENLCSRVIKAMLQAHPYEEVAYDLYTLNSPAGKCGLGRVGNLAEEMQLEELAGKVKVSLGAGHIRLIGENKPMKVVAVCGGAGGSLVARAKEAGADVLVTGDVKYHDAMEAIDSGLAVIDAGHYFTERPVVDVVATYLRECAAGDGWSVTVEADDGFEDVFRMF